MGRRLLLLGEAKYYQEALGYRLEGMTYGQIGEKLGLSRQRAQQILRPPKIIYDSVRTRAEYKCDNCGLLTQIGHIHHIENRDMDYNDIANLRYLCVSCHKQIHLNNPPPPCQSNNRTLSDSIHKTFDIFIADL